MAAIWLWVRSEWRRGWAGLLALALLIAFAGGVSLAVLAGARRADSALDRFEAATNNPQIGVEPVEPDELSELENWPGSLPAPEELADRLTSVPGVEGVSVFTFLGAGVAPDGEFFNVAMSADRGRAPRAMVLEGRMPEPTDPDEVLVNETAASEWGSIGDTLTLHTLDPSQLPVMVGAVPGEPGGPDIDVRVVGIMRDIEAITDSPEPILAASPAFVARHRDDVLMFTALAQVTADPTRLDEVVAGVGAAAGEDFVAAPPSEDFAGRADDAISVEVTALSVFASAAVIAGLVILYQVISRQTASMSNEALTRLALGFTRRDHAIGSVVRTAPAALTGVLVAAGLAVAVSPLFPRGLARRAEPDLGVQVDASVLAVGALAILAAVAGLAALTGWSSGRRAALRPPRVPPVVVSGMAESLSPPAGFGVRSALAPRGRWRQAGWAGITGAAVAVAGFLAVVTVESSVDRLLSTPRLFGAGWDAVIVTEPGADPSALADRVATDPDVAAVGRLDELAAESIDATGPGGSGPVEPEAFEPLIGTVTPTVTDGRLPTGPSEVAIGENVARMLGAGLGDPIEVAGAEQTVRFVVVGQVLNAGADDLGNGFAVTRAGLEALTDGCPTDSDKSGCTITTAGVGVALEPGVDRDAALARLAEIEPAVVPTEVPSIVGNLEQIGSTPWLLAGFLGLLGAAGLIHAMATSSSRRDHDLAIGRALGLSQGQARATVRWQAVVLAAAGAIVGLILGVVAGRLVWRRVAEGTGAIVETVIPVWAMLAAPAGALLLALVIAGVPAARAAGRRPADQLRTE